MKPDADLQAIYDHYRAIIDELDVMRDAYYAKAKEKNDAFDRIREAMEAGDVEEVRHDEDHVATITAKGNVRMPGISISIKIEGQVNERRVLMFGDSTEGEKITRKK